MVSEQLEGRGARVFPSFGNFISADFGSGRSVVFRSLEKAGILIRERKDIGPGFVRITIGTEAELKRFSGRFPGHSGAPHEQNRDNSP